VALLIRIDVDRPYGRAPLLRHALSRLGSDAWFPRIEPFGYLAELRAILELLEAHGARAHVFFRRCTLPSPKVLEMLRRGGHVIGLHLEDSRSFATFLGEKRSLEKHLDAPIFVLSKHGSGVHRYGLRHHAPYEPERYVDWARRSSMLAFFGNREDPSLAPVCDGGVRVHPGAFWLEPAWRDVQAFGVDWLMQHAAKSDIVLLMHPENILAEASLTRHLERIVGALPSIVVEPAGAGV
jgi:hypothetical protein